MIDAITLTVVQNRFRQIAEDMDTIFDRAAFSRRQVTVLKLKIEDFDDFEQAMGGEVARALIAKTAQALKAECRAMDLVARGSTDELEVNSMHHQAIKRLGRGLTAVAWAPDQIVEGAELDDPGRFVLGVQWHPEELVGHSEPARRLFAALVAAARPS